MTSAEHLLELAGDDPLRAHAVASSLRDAADPALRVAALRALALSGKELGRLDESLRHLREALATAEEAGLDYAAAQVRSSLVALLAARGQVGSALAAADAAAPVLRGPDAARLAANRICALARGGRLAEARALALTALSELPELSEPSELAQSSTPGLLTNAGLALATCGELEAAQACLTEAGARADRAGLRLQAAMARANLAFTASRSGDLPLALRLYAAAEPDLTGVRALQTRLDRAETLIAAGLPGEARPLIEAVLPGLAAGGHDGDVADGLLLLARAELADGDPERAAGTAERARTAYAGQDRPGWALLCEHLLLRARWAAGDRSAVFFRTAVATADRLASGGWVQEAADGTIVAALLALHLRRPATALLEQADSARHDGPAALRAAAWHATALSRSLQGDRRGAGAAVRAGLRVVAEHAAALGALELRVHAAHLGADLADLGLALAGSGRALLAAEERRRALAWRPAPVRPPADPQSAWLLSELRRVGSENEAAAATGGDVTELTARQVSLEAELRARVRMRPAPAAPPPARPSHSGRPSHHSHPGDSGHSGRPEHPDRFALRDLIGELGDRALVELVRVGGELHAVTLAQGRCRRWPLGDYEPAARECLALRSALRRLVWHGDDGAGPLDPVAKLEALLPARLRRVVGDRELVLAPAGALHGLPWAALPFLSGRPVSVVPSAAAWLRARKAAPPAPGGRVVLAAGPGLAHAVPEITALAWRYPGARVLHGGAATAETLREALDGAGLAHLAAHGVFRAGNPLLSGLRLTGGPLLVHDLEGLHRPPGLVVLSACDAGRAEDGEAVMGMASVLLAFGTSCVIASVAPVRDETARTFMITFHDRLAAGLSPARALAAVARTPGVLGFQCLGAG